MSEFEVYRGEICPDRGGGLQDFKLAGQPEPIISERRDEDPKLTLDRIDMHIDGKNIGYLTSHPATDGGVWLKGLKVDPEHRGQGYATKLLEHALEKYKDQQLSMRAKPYDDKPVDVEALKRFYQRYGFEVYDDENRMRRIPSKIKSGL